MIVWVDNARIISIFVVVLFHVALFDISSASIFNSSRWWIENLFNSFGRWSVPVFVMLSGSLLLSDSKVESISVFYKKRLDKLIIPIIFWSLFYLGLRNLHHIMQQGTADSIRWQIKILLTGRPYYHMWFIFMILGLYFLTPFLRILIRHTSNGQLHLFVIVSMLIVMCNSLFDSVYRGMFEPTDALFINLFLYWVPYFIIGYIISKSSWKPSNKMLILVATLSVIFTALGVFWLGNLIGLERGWYFYNLASITLVPMSLSMMFILKNLETPLFINQKANSQLAGLVLGVYIIHPAMIELLKYFGIYTNTFNTLVSVPLISIIVFSACAILAWFIRQIPYLKRIL